MVAYAKKMGYFSPALTNGAGTAQWTTNGDIFSNVQSAAYWSSTMFSDAISAWCLPIDNGFAGSSIKSSDEHGRYSISS